MMIEIYIYIKHYIIESLPVRVFMIWKDDAPLAGRFHADQEITIARQKEYMAGLKDDIESDKKEKEQARRGPFFLDCFARRLHKHCTVSMRWSRC